MKKPAAYFCRPGCDPHSAAAVERRKKDENAKGKGKNTGKNKGSKTGGKKNQRKSKHSTLRRLSSKLRESKQGQEEVMPSGSAEPPVEHDLQQEAGPKRKCPNSKVPSKGKKALKAPKAKKAKKAKADSVEEAETGHGTPETGGAKNVRKHKSTKGDKGKQVGKAKRATKTKKEKTTSHAKTKKGSKKTGKKKNQVEPAQEEDNKLPESDAPLDAARDAEDSQFPNEKVNIFFLGCRNVHHIVVRNSYGSVFFTGTAPKAIQARRVHDGDQKHSGQPEPPV